MRLTVNKARADWELVKAQRKVWLFPLIAAAVVLGSCIFLLIPQIQLMLEDQDKLKQTELKLEKLVNKRTFLEGLNETEIDTQLVEATRVLPRKKPVYQIVEALATEMAENELVLESFELSPGRVASATATKEPVDKPEEIGVLTSLAIDFTASGPMSGVMSFLTRLKTLAPLSSVAELTVDVSPNQWFRELNLMTETGEIEMLKIGGSEVTDLIQIEGKLLTYYALPPGSVGVEDEAFKPISEAHKAVIAGLSRYRDYTRPQSLSEVVEIDNQRIDVFNF